MSWKDLFDNNFLLTGKRYCSEGRVKKVSFKNNTLNAAVLDKTLYAVTVFNPSDEYPQMSCSCDIFRKGIYCMHLAALMYVWSENKDGDDYSNKKNLLEEAFPNTSGRNTYYDIKRIAEREHIYFDREPFDKARELIDQNKVTLNTVILKYSNYGFYDNRIKILRADFRTESYPDRTFIEISRKKIVECHCEACNLFLYNIKTDSLFEDDSNIAPCEHLLAALMLLNDYIQHFDPGDGTDMAGDKFLGYFADKRQKSAAADNGLENGRIQLVPRLVKEAYDSTGNYDVSFRIGNGGKLYVVKNINNIFRAEENGEILKLGKNTEINFKTERFDKESLEYYQIAKKFFNSNKIRFMNFNFANYDFYGDYMFSIKSLPLEGELIDVIYENYIDKSIEVKSDSYDADYLKIARKSPKIHIDVEVSYSDDEKTGKKDKLSALKISGSLPQIIYGSKYKYFLYNGIISRMSDDMPEQLAPFFEASSDDGHTFSFVIGKKMAAEFYYRILPELNQGDCFDINEISNIENIIPPEAKSYFYLDVEDGKILCKSEVVYDDKKHLIEPLKKDDKIPEAYRDIYRENVVRNLLEEIFEIYYPEKNSYALEDSDESKYDFLRYDIGRLFAEGEVNSTEAFSALKIRQKTPVQLGVSVKSNLLDIELMTEGMDEDELALVLSSYRLKKKYHRLRSGDFVELEGNEELDSFVNTMDALGVTAEDFSDGNLKLPVYRALYLDSMLEEHEAIVADRDKHFRSLIKNFKTINDSDFDVPESLKKIYRPYQEYGFKWLKTLETAGFCGILADDMGLGKTAQILGALLHHKEEEGSLKALVICPASLVYNWAEETEKFVPSLKAVVLAGTKKEREIILEDSESADIYITSYDLLKRDIKLYENVTFTHEILDEAQFIKNAKAVAAKSVKLVHAKHRMALTGTPIENRLSELWSIFDFLMPGFLYAYDDFKKKYELPISKYGNKDATEALKKQVSPFILRRKKEDVLKELPEKTEEVVYSVMENKQRTLYDAQLVRTKKTIASSEEDFNNMKIKILAELTRLRQICCDPSLLFEDYNGESAKRQTCMELVKSAADAGHKMLLFSQFTSMLELLESDLVNENIAFKKITGATSKEDRMRFVKEFNSDDTPVFLISLKAGGTGLNLTGADIVIHYDPWWNTAAQDQATDRAHRIGQTKRVTVYKVIAKGTIEEKILKLQETKKELADSILSGETKSLGAMSQDELMEILG